MHPPRRVYYQGEVVKRDALMSALGDYMKFANIREMHQLSAVGVAKEVAVDDKRAPYVGAKIIDPVAWQKVIEGVYKGYSIGGRVTQRDPADHKTITGLVLNEISLVDRPANPEAIFDYWKISRSCKHARGATQRTVSNLGLRCAGTPSLRQVGRGAVPREDVK